MFFLRARCIWNLSSVCTKDRSGGDKQLLLPSTLNQGDESKKNCLEQLYLTSSPSGKSTPPSHLAINKPVPSSPLSPSPLPCSRALHICEKVIISQSGVAGCHAACQPQEEQGHALCQGKTVCFHAVLISTQYFKYSSRMMFEIVARAFDLQHLRANRFIFKYQKESAIFLCKFLIPDRWIRLTCYSFFVISRNNTYFQIKHVPQNRIILISHRNNDFWCERLLRFNKVSCLITWSSVISLKR